MKQNLFTVNESDNFAKELSTYAIGTLVRLHVSGDCDIPLLTGFWADFRKCHRKKM